MLAKVIQFTGYNLVFSWNVSILPVDDSLQNTIVFERKLFAV